LADSIEKQAIVVSNLALEVKKLREENVKLQGFRELVYDFIEASGKVMSYYDSAMRAATSELDLPELTDGKAKSLLRRLGKMQFPSLIEQLETTFEGRVLLDRYFSDLLQMEIDEEECRNKNSIENLLS